MNSAIGSLNLNRPQPKNETSSGLGLCNTARLKHQLLGEMVELDKQLELLKCPFGSVDFSMMQTYREMIHSRKILFNDLSY